MLPLSSNLALYRARICNDATVLQAFRQQKRRCNRADIGSCMKQEPPIERSEALRDAPVFGSSPLGGSSPKGRALMR